jgi:hypothetical protein
MDASQSVGCRTQTVAVTYALANEDSRLAQVLFTMDDDLQEVESIAVELRRRGLHVVTLEVQNPPMCKR